MTKGYSFRFIQTMEALDSTKLGVRLGQLCIQNDIPVKDVSELLKISRVTVYNWFTGKTKVKANLRETVERIIQKLEPDV